MNPNERAKLMYSLATIGFYLILIPLHEASHVLAARLENLPVTSYSLLSFNPSVVLSVPGTLEFFLAGPIVILVIVGVGLWYSWDKPMRNYFLALLIAELAADIVDFEAILRLATHS